MKRLRFHYDRWWASGDNDSPENGSRPLDGDDGIIGRVVWWAHTIVEGDAGRLSGDTGVDAGSRLEAEVG